MTPLAARVQVNVQQRFLHTGGGRKRGGRSPAPGRRPDGERQRRPPQRLPAGGHPPGEELP